MNGSQKHVFSRNRKTIIKFLQNSWILNKRATKTSLKVSCCSFQRVLWRAAINTSASTQTSQRMGSREQSPGVDCQRPSNIHTGDKRTLTGTPHTRTETIKPSSKQRKTASLHWIWQKSPKHLIQQQHSPSRQAIAWTDSLGDWKSPVWSRQTSKNPTTSSEVGRRANEGR